MRWRKVLLASQRSKLRALTKGLIKVKRSSRNSSPIRWMRNFDKGASIPDRRFPAAGNLQRQILHCSINHFDGGSRCQAPFACEKLTGITRGWHPLLIPEGGRHVSEDF